MSILQIIPNTFYCSTVSGYILNFENVPSQEIEICYWEKKISYIHFKNSDRYIDFPFKFKILNLNEIMIELENLSIKCNH